MRFRRTPAQIAAARRNGALSRGPITPAGKQISSQNSRRHGIYAKAILLPGESEAEFTRVATQINDRFAPRDPVESIYVQRMIVAQWQQLRVLNYEQAGLTAGIAAATNQDDPDPDPTLAHLASFYDLHGQSRSASLLTARTRFTRQFDQAVAKLKQLRASPELKNFETNRRTESKQTANRNFDEPNPHPVAAHMDPMSPQRGPAVTQNEPEPVTDFNELASS